MPEPPQARFPVDKGSLNFVVRPLIQSLLTMNTAFGARLISGKFFFTNRLPNAQLLSCVSTWRPLLNAIKSAITIPLNNLAVCLSLHFSLFIYLFIYLFSDCNSRTLMRWFIVTVASPVFYRLESTVCRGQRCRAGSSSTRWNRAVARMFFSR